MNSDGNCNKVTFSAKPNPWLETYQKSRIVCDQLVSFGWYHDCHNLTEFNSSRFKVTRSSSLSHHISAPLCFLITTVVGLTTSPLVSQVILVSSFVISLLWCLQRLSSVIQASFPTTTMIHRTSPTMFRTKVPRNLYQTALIFYLIWFLLLFIIVLGNQALTVTASNTIPTFSYCSYIFLKNEQSPPPPTAPPASYHPSWSTSLPSRNDANRLARSSRSPTAPAPPSHDHMFAYNDDVPQQSTHNRIHNQQQQQHSRTHDPKVFGHMDSNVDLHHHLRSHHNHHQSHPSSAATLKSPAPTSTVHQYYHTHHYHHHHSHPHQTSPGVDGVSTTPTTTTSSFDSNLAPPPPSPTASTESPRWWTSTNTPVSILDHSDGSTSSHRLLRHDRQVDEDHDRTQSPPPTTEEVMDKLPVQRPDRVNSWSVPPNSDQANYAADDDDDYHDYHPSQYHYQFSYSPPSNSHPVYIGLEIIDVDRINDAENFFSLQLHLFELWHEPRINTSALQMFWASNGDPIPVHEANIADCLWTPSLVFEDSTEKERLLPPTTILLAYQNRVLLRKSRYSLKVRCHMNLQIYPMDKHLCHFKLRTFTDPVHKVNLRWLSDPESPKPDLLDNHRNRCVIHSNEFTPSLFDIKVGSAARINHVWLNEHYSLLDVEFIFERRIIHSLLTVYIPSSLVVTLSWLQFWFDVEAVPGRMSLGIMSTLTIMTQILTNYEKAGNHVTAVDIWLFVCLIMVFLALMEYAVAYTISHYYDTEPDMMCLANTDSDMDTGPHSWFRWLSCWHRSTHSVSRKSWSSQTSSVDTNNNHHSSRSNHHHNSRKKLTDPNRTSPYRPCLGSSLRLNLLQNSIKHRTQNKVDQQRHQDDSPSTPPPPVEKTPVYEFDKSKSQSLPTTRSGRSSEHTQLPQFQSNDRSVSEEQLYQDVADDNVTADPLLVCDEPPPKTTKSAKQNELPALLSLLQKDNLDEQLGRQWSELDHIEVARLRVQLALDELEDLLQNRGESLLAPVSTISSGKALNQHDSMRRFLLPSGMWPKTGKGNDGEDGNRCHQRRRATDSHAANVATLFDEQYCAPPPPPSPSMALKPRTRRPLSSTIRRQYSSRTPEDSRCGGRSSLNEVDYCSRYVFPIAFVLFVVVYWTVLIYYKLTS